MKNWKIFYADFTTFGSDEGEASDARPTGVICIKQRNSMHGWVLTAMKDYYLWQHRQWWGADAAGFWQYLFAPGEKVILFGQSAPDEIFQRVMAAAIADPGFGEKSAISPLDHGQASQWT